MRKRISIAVGAASLLLWAVPVTAATILLRGKVVMQDGSAPGKSVTLERFCAGFGSSIIAATTSKTGWYLYSADVEAANSNNCALRAALKGYESTVVPIGHLNSWSDPNLPDMILRVHDASLGERDSRTASEIYFLRSPIPPNARQPWSNAIKAMEKSNWAVAESQLRIVVKEAPNMAEAWHSLGEVAQVLKRLDDAAEALENAVRLDPKLTSAQLRLLRVYVELKKWEQADAVASALLKLEADGQNPEIYAHRAIVRFNLGNLAGAESSVQEGLRRDTKHQVPRLEMILATILEARGDYAGAREHLQRYLDLDPRAADAADIRLRMTTLGQVTTGAPPVPTMDAIDIPVEGAGEAWVPGGMKALAKMASMPHEPAYHTFFEEYCRTIGREVSIGTGQGIPGYTQGLRTFLANVAELIPLGEKRGDATIIRISAATRERRVQAQRVLALLGWTLEENNGTVEAEPGSRPADGLSQTVAWALGVDQIAMQQALQSGAEFQFEIVSENARLAGGNGWTQILAKEVPPGGLASVFATDVRIAKTCAGLNAMSTSTAAAIMSAVGLRNLAAKYAEVIYRYGEGFSITDGRVDVPGGPSADPAWQKLVGANPRNPGQFFDALVEKDAGRVAAFYATLARADAAHQQYFTRSPERAERFYLWFRDSPEMRNGIVVHVPSFHSEFLQAVPLDSAGNVRFPGGQSVWFPGAEIPLESPLLRALLPVARVEEKRGSPLDEQIAGLLIRNHGQWTALYPYFENLPSLGREEYAALAAFTESLPRRRADERNAVLGEWYALVELITRGVKAGSLDGPAAARAFREVAQDLRGDAHATRAIAILRELAGRGDLEAAVAANLLRLDTVRAARFDRVLELLRAPRLSTTRLSDVPAALSAVVYAASLDPGLLLLNEDPALLGRHRYSTGNDPLFKVAELHGSGDVGGAHFSGGFSGFEDAAKRLMGGAKAPPRLPVVARSAPQAAGSDDAPSADFRSGTKLVEVYATVTDNRGRYVDDLTVARFSLMDGKDPQKIIAFEPQAADLSVVLLLDTTGSMADTIPSLKKAALRLIDSFRPGDSVAVYSFSDQVTELAPFTTDRGVAKRAVMNVRPLGNTALFDAIARAEHELTGRGGKKVVIVFTDGNDTSSMLRMDAAIERAKMTGVPVYTIAQGEANAHPDLVRHLAAISNATGGVPFQVSDPNHMDEVFQKISDDLSHGYLLLFQPPSSDDHAWRELHVVVGGQREVRIRAREGYYR